MMAEVPIVIKNSHLMNALLLELQEQLTLDVGGAQFLDLGTSGSFNIFWSLYRAVLRTRIRWISNILASWIRIRIKIKWILSTDKLVITGFISVKFNFCFFDNAYCRLGNNSLSMLGFQPPSFKSPLPSRLGWANYGVNFS